MKICGHTADGWRLRIRNLWIGLAASLCILLAMSVIYGTQGERNSILHLLFNVMDETMIVAFSAGLWIAYRQRRIQRRSWNR